MKKHLTRWLSGLLLMALLASMAVLPAAAAVRFSDVPANSWAASSIQRCVSLGLFQGERADRFGMGHAMTRGAFVVVLGRLFGWEAAAPAAGSYTDNQDPAAWYYSAVETALANGAVTLQSDAFRPNDPITREEMAVMLVRALGYGTIAGLVQDLPMPFRDVTSNAGYIAMAYELGIVSGTSKTAFSPNRAATREQAAVMLVRVYDRLHAAAMKRTGILTNAADAAQAEGCGAVGIAAARILCTAATPTLLKTMSAKDAAAARERVQSQGGKALLYAAGSVNLLKAQPQEAATLLADAVAEGAYDGLFLDIPEVGVSWKDSYTQLISALKTALEGKFLYLKVEAPTWQGRNYGGYDYAALASRADGLVIQPASPESRSGTFPIAPVEPLEEIYYAVSQLKNQVPAEKLILALTTTGALFQAGQRSGSADAGQIDALLKKKGAEQYYSDRYGCAYLTVPGAKGDTVVWYLNADAVRARVRLAAFLGVGQICLSDLGSVSENVSAALG